MLLARIFGRSLHHQVSRYFYRHRKRSVDVDEIVRVFMIRPEESVRLLRQLPEEMRLRDAGGDSFILSDKAKAEFNAVRNGAIVLIVVAILAIYTIIIRAMGIGCY